MWRATILFGLKESKRERESESERERAGEPEKEREIRMMMRVCMRMCSCVLARVRNVEKLFEFCIYLNKLVIAY